LTSLSSSAAPPEVSAIDFWTLINYNFNRIWRRKYLYEEVSWVGDDSAKEIQALDKANQKGFDAAFDEMEESDKAREKSAKETSDQIKNDGSEAKDPVDSMGLSDEAKDEKKTK
jgi:hypothetical protein